MSQAGIVVKDIWKTYNGQRYVLRGVTFEVPPNELALITGRSGTGKTTLLNIIGCIDAPTKGSVFLNGYEITALPPRELTNLRLHHIGIVFQSHNLIDSLTVRDNIALPLRIAKVKNPDVKVRALLRAFDITNIERAKPNEISGGERQRVAIARALSNNPSILLADEPTASLDVENCEIVFDAFRQAQEMFNTTILIASHDQFLADRIPHRYALDTGKIREGGTP